MSAARLSQEPLDALIQQITNPLNSTYNPQLVYAFCERVKQQEDGPVAATRLLAYRVQSPQEKEAMLALDLLDTCARTGGPGFQAELGKFRFLNELIKLLSPRYLGSRTPQRVKQRVADLLMGWSRQMPHETKIQEAFTLLQKQGLLDMHGLDPNRPPTPPLPSTDRPANPIFDDGQKAALLKRLLQSTNPEDIQAANRLIKTMVKQDEERSERVSRRVTELEMVHSNLRLLQEMMDNYSPETTSRDELELMTELCTSCEQLRGKLDSLAAETDDQDSALGDLVSASELIGATLTRHRDLLTSGGGAPLTLLQLESPEEQRLPPAAAAGETPETSQEMLQKQLERLGLSDSVPSPPSGLSAGLPSGLPSGLPAGLPSGLPSGLPAGLPSGLSGLSAGPAVGHQPDLLSHPVGPPPPPLSAATAAGPGPSLADLLGSFGSPPAPVPSQIQPPQPPPAAAAAAVGLTGMVMTQPRPRPTQLPQAPAAAAALLSSQPPARSAFDDLDHLVRRSMLDSAAVAGPTPTDREFSVSSSSISTNQAAASVVSPRPPPPSANQTPPPSPGRAAGAEPNDRHPITDLLGDDVSLLSTLSGPSSHDSLLSETGSAGGQTGSAGGQTGPAGGQTGPAGGQTGPAGGQGQPGAAGDASSRDRPASLAEVTVSLEEIQPGGGAPVPLFSEPTSLEISLHPAGNQPRDDVTVYVITALNRTGRPVTQYTLQAVCDKTARVRLQAPSTADLPAGSPFLPPPAASQVLLLARPGPQMSVHLRFMLSYSVDGDVVTEMAEARLPGQS